MTIINPLPYSFSNGSTADATQVNANFAQIVSNVNANAVQASSSGAASYKGAAIANSGPVSIPNTTLTAVAASGIILDTSSIFNISNPTRLTVPTGTTLIRISATVSIGTTHSPNDVVAYMQFKKNGTEIAPYGINLTTQSNLNGLTTGTFVTTPLAVTSGDYFELFLFATSLGTMTIPNNAYYFEMQILG